jgi:hypothetical protein
MANKTTKGWLDPNGKPYKGEWTNPSVLLLMGVLPPDLYQRAHRPNLDLGEWAALRSFRGTGQYVGEDARFKDKERKNYEWETLMVLRARGLLEHSWCDRWYLTEKGREALKRRDVCLEAD